jgi:hypothetical protein
MFFYTYTNLFDREICQNVYSHNLRWRQQDGKLQKAFNLFHWISPSHVLYIITQQMLDACTARKVTKSWQGWEEEKDSNLRDWMSTSNTHPRLWMCVCVKEFIDCVRSHLLAYVYVCVCEFELGDRGEHRRTVENCRQSQIRLS